MKKTIALFALIILSLVLAACSSYEEADYQIDDFNDKGYECKNCNVIFVLVDTLRADHMGINGYYRNTTPFIDGFFSNRSVHFSNTRSQAGCTFPSINSLLTSKYSYHFINGPDQQLTKVSSNGVYRYKFKGIPDSYDSIETILQEEGYSTYAVSASPVVRDTPSSYNRDGGFRNGFDEFDESCYRDDAGCINNKVSRFIKKTDRPFFMYLHYMEPHSPYDTPYPFKKEFSDREYDGDIEDLDKRTPKPIEMMIRENRNDEIEDSDIQFLIDSYDDEILYFDSKFQELITDLDEKEMLNNTIIVFMSDHGEEFLEHEYIAHCHSLYEPVIKVPLAFYFPGQEEGIHIDSLAQNLDIVPTVLDYLSIDYEDYDFDGVSLRPAIENNDVVNTHSFSNQNKYRSIIDSKDYKLIKDISENRSELYNIGKDPLEQKDLVDTNRRKLESLTTDLHEWLIDLEGSIASEESLQEAEKIEEELLALGYLG